MNENEVERQEIIVPIPLDLCLNPTKSDTFKYKTRRLRGRKALMVAALKKSLGVIARACKEINLSRETHYEWIKNDPEYKRACETLPEEINDAFESAFINLVAQGNPQAIIHAAKTRLRDRGYGEVIELPKPQEEKFLRIVEISVEEEFEESIKHYGKEKVLSLLKKNFPDIK